MRQLVDSVALEGDHGTTVVLRLRLRHGPDSDEAAAAADGQATVVVNRSDGPPVVVAHGAVDESSAESMRIRLLEASHGGTVPVELDLTDVVLFSSSGVRVVLAFARIARDEGWRLVVRAPEGGVTRHILEISGLSGVVDLR
jgi:anti-anti-sigma factor